MGCCIVRYRARDRCVTATGEARGAWLDMQSPASGGRDGSARSDLSEVRRTSLEAVHDPPARDVVETQFDLDAVARQNADVVHPELAGTVSEHELTRLELDLEASVP